MRLRSIVLVAAGEDGGAAFESEADAVAYTLADARHDLVTLRGLARAGIQRGREAGKTVLAAINHPRTRLLRDDLEGVVGEGLAGVLLPHTFEPQDVRDLSVGLREFELARGIEPGAIRSLPVIDSARGVVRAAEIAAATPRVAGLVFDGRAYAADTGARDEEVGPRLAYARGAVVAAARAADALPIVAAAGFDLVQLSQCGFAGALLPNARAVAAANVAFAPTDAVLADARARREAYAAARAEGAWVARLGDALIDVHADRKASQTIDHG